jgi:hypothetical protein
MKKEMKKMLVGVACGSMFMCAALNAGADVLINPGFETGDHAGWATQESFATVESSWAGNSSTYGPAEGKYFLALTAGQGTGVYTTASQVLDLSAGESISGAAAFDYKDYHSFDDSAYVRILDVTGALLATPWFENGLAHPDYWDGPWTNWTWTASSPGTYILQYGVANFGDNALASAGLFDAQGGSVPEPATMLIFGTGLAGLAGLRIRRKK